MSGSEANIPDASWYRLHARYVATPPYDSAFNFRVSVAATTGTKLYVDDAQVWVRRRRWVWRVMRLERLDQPLRDQPSHPRH